MIFTSKCGHGKSRPPFSRCPGIKRAGNLFQDFLLGGAAGGRLVFSFESSGQAGSMINSSINEKLFFCVFISCFYPKINVFGTYINSSNNNKPSKNGVNVHCFPRQLHNKKDDCHEKENYGS